MPNSAPSKKSNWKERFQTLPLLFTPFERMLILTAAVVLLAATFPITRSTAPATIRQNELPSLRSLVVADSIVHFPLDVNHASRELLELVPGIGKVTAQRIIQARRAKPFRTLEELDERVNGIGPVTFERIRPFLTVDSDSILHKP
ncbi:MAG: helix-hairpin-helix domain-containing protein [bacterium]|nr:helix-hairpin-helix domain-containing protein [bacterium]